MTPERTITFRIPEKLLSSTLRAARAEEMTTGEFIRLAVADRVAELDCGEHHDAVSTLRQGLRRDFAEANDWLDLQQRLRANNLVLRLCEGEVTLMTWPVEERLVPISRLGVTAEELTILYRAPFPAPKAKEQTLKLPYLLMNPVELAA